MWVSNDQAEPTSVIDTGDDQLVEALLIEAGLPTDDRRLLELSAPTSTNVSYLVHTQGRTLVARRYAWPYGETDLKIRYRDGRSGLPGPLCGRRLR